MTYGSHERGRRTSAPAAPAATGGREHAARRPLAFTLRELLDAARGADVDGLRAVGVYCIAVVLSERSTSDLARVAGCSRSTAKRALRDLANLLDKAATPAVERPVRDVTTRTSGVQDQGEPRSRGGVSGDPGGSDMTPTGGSDMTPVPFGPGVLSALHTENGRPAAAGHDGGPATRCAPRRARSAAGAWLRDRGVSPTSRRFRRAMADLDRAWRADGSTWEDPPAVAVRVIQAWYAEGSEGIAQLARAHRTNGKRRDCSRCGSPLRGRCCINAGCSLYLHRQEG